MFRKSILAWLLLITPTWAAGLLDSVQQDSTDHSVTIFIMDSTDGTPETGVAYNTAGIDLWYRREGAAVTSLTEADIATLTTAHTDSGIIHISHGEYRLDLPDAAFASGAEFVDVGGTVTGMIVIGGRVDLTDYAETDDINTEVDTAIKDYFGIHTTTIATYTDGDTWTLTAGSTDDAAYKDWTAIVVDQSTPTQVAVGMVDSYTGSTKTVQLVNDPGVFTAQAGDKVILIPTFNANAGRVNDESLTGDGTSGTEWGPE